MTRLVRARRGRVAHLASCRRLRSTDTVEVEDEDASRWRLCEHCLPTCVVCASARGRPMPCGDHGMCDECADTYLRLHVEEDRALPDGALLPPCPCGAGPSLDPHRDLSPTNLRNCMHRALQNRRPPTSPVLSSLGQALREESRSLACPNCARPFVDFDGCAALECRCGAWFCALCLTPCRDARDAHSHVRRCSLNPGSSFYVSLPTCRRVWLRRARVRARAALVRLFRNDGWLAALGGMAALRRHDPELFGILPRLLPLARRAAVRTLCDAWYVLRVLLKFLFGAWMATFVIALLEHSVLA